MKAIGYWSALNGIEVFDIIHSDVLKVKCVSNAWGGTKKEHLVRLYYTNTGREYIKLYGNRYYLDECLRI